MMEPGAEHIEPIIIALVIIAFLVLAGGIAYLVSRRPENPLPPPAIGEPGEDPAARQALQQVVDERGDELLDRRVELDMSRGTLGGDTKLYEQLEELEQRLRAREISEDEFEREKIRLLGG